MEIQLPPLRLRGDDIATLATQLLHRSCQRLNRHPLRLSDEALARMRHYPWPGNVRELQNAIERAVILADGEEIDALALGLTPHPPSAATPTLSLDDYFVSFVRENEGQLNETELAKQLGISRKTLWERRQRLGIPKRH
jgi:DNA-binding NtrC family response regulator